MEGGGRKGRADLDPQGPWLGAMQIKTGEEGGVRTARQRGFGGPGLRVEGGAAEAQGWRRLEEQGVRKQLAPPCKGPGGGETTLGSLLRG